MNKSLLMYTLRQHWRLFAIFVSILLMYLLVIIGMIDMGSMEELREMFGMAGGFLDAFGMNVDAMTDVLSYTASTFFSLLIMAFTMVYYIITVRRIVIVPVQDNSMAFVLSMPISRVKYLATQIIYLLGSMLLMFALLFGSGAIFMNTKEPINVLAYLDLVTLTMLLNMSIAILVLLVGVVTCTSAKYSHLATALPIALILVNMVGDVGGEALGWLSDITPFGWLDSVAIVNGTAVTWWMYIVLGMFVAIGSIASVWIFKNKDLSL